jgi:hypothetical protein
VAVWKNTINLCQTYVSEIKRERQGKENCVAVTKQGQPTWSRVIKKDEKEKDRYYISRYETEYEYIDELNMLFPRMYSSTENHVSHIKNGRISKERRLSTTVAVKK